MKPTPIKKILILVAILAFPGFLYYLLQEKGKNRYKTLARFGPKEVAATFHTRRGKKIPDTIYHALQNVKLVNENADTLLLDTVNNQIYIAGLFYTRGGYSANITMNAMSGLFATYKKNRRISFLSITVDPLYDTPGILRAYRQNLKPASAGSADQQKKWHFLTGPETDVYRVIKEGLLLDVLNTNGKISYNNMLVLLDHQHNIRGYYDATSREAVAKLDDEIKVLMTEELRNINDGR